MFSRWTSALFALLAFGLLGFWISRTARELVRNPVLGGETLTAMGLALEWQVRDPLELHERTLAAAREELTPEAFLALTSNAGAAATDPALFQSELAARRGGVAYSVAVRMLHEQGLALSASTWWVSLGCYAFLALLFLGWSAEYLPLGWCFLLTLALAHAPGLLAQANQSGAHFLAAAFFSFGAWALLARRLFFVAAPLFLLGLAALPETIFLSVFLALALLLLARGAERPSVPALILWLVASVAVWIALELFAAGQGLGVFVAGQWERLQVLLAAGKPSLVLPAGLDRTVAGACGAGALIALVVAAKRGLSATAAFLVALLLGGVLCLFDFGGGPRLLPFLEVLVPMALLNAARGKPGKSEGGGRRRGGAGAAPRAVSPREAPSASTSS